jgi:hypothetical protein
LGKLTGFDQEASAIDFPWRGIFFHNHFPLGKEMKKDIRYATAGSRLPLSPAQPRCGGVITVAEFG